MRHIEEENIGSNFFALARQVRAESIAQAAIKIQAARKRSYQRIRRKAERCLAEARQAAERESTFQQADKMLALEVYRNNLYSEAWRQATELAIQMAERVLQRELSTSSASLQTDIFQLAQGLPTSIIKIELSPLDIAATQRELTKLKLPMSIVESNSNLASGCAVLVMTSGSLTIDPREDLSRLSDSLRSALESKLPNHLPSFM